MTDFAKTVRCNESYDAAISLLNRLRSCEGIHVFENFAGQVDGGVFVFVEEPLCRRIRLVCHLHKVLCRSSSDDGYVNVAYVHVRLNNHQQTDIRIYGDSDSRLYEEIRAESFRIKNLDDGLGYRQETSNVTLAVEEHVWNV